MNHREAYHRSTYLSERTVPGKVADYGGALHDLEKVLGRRNPAIQSVLARTSAACHAHMPEFEAGPPSGWTQYLERICQTAARTDVSLLPHLEGELDLEDLAFARPFLPAASCLLEDLCPKLRRIGCAEKNGVTNTIESWFVRSAVTLAEPTLYTDFKSMGRGYNEWCRHFVADDPEANRWHAIADDFPVLLRLLARLHDDAIIYLTELFDRLAVDRERLYTTFGVAPVEDLIGIDLGLSDRHHKGRTVARLHFHSGKRLIYKPKALEQEAWFNALTAEAGAAYGLGSLKVLQGEHYGWVEDAFQLEANELSPEGYPEQIGFCASLLWLLNASDLHHANICFSQGVLYILDVETLFSASIMPTAQPNEPEWRNWSVTSTDLFQATIGRRAQQQDASGLFGGDAVSPFPTVHFFRVDDDVQSHVARTAPFPENLQDRRPVGHSHELASRISDAFERAVAPLAKDILPRHIANLPTDAMTRFILRPTMFYARLNQRLRQPRFMRDGALTSIELAKLYVDLRDASENSEAMAVLVADEIAQIERGDIPYFWARSSGRHLHGMTATTYDLLQTNGRTLVQQKLTGIAGSDVAEQRALIEAALDSHEGFEGSTRSRSRRAVGRRSDTLLDALGDLARNVRAGGFRPPDGPSRWLSYAGDVAGCELRATVGDRSFYGGAWGVLLFLVAVDRVLAEAHRRDSELAWQIDVEARRWQTVLQSEMVRHHAHSKAGFGFTGIGGTLWVWGQLVRLDPNRWAFLEGVLQDVLNGISTGTIDSDSVYDVIGGSAGVILGCQSVLDGVSENASQEAARSVLARAARTLANAAQPLGGAAAWPCSVAQAPLLSYAHGWAGCVVALRVAECRLQGWLEEADAQRISATRTAAALYPDSLLDAHGVWLDLRHDVSADTPLNRSWCHGFAGVTRGLIDGLREISERARTRMRAELRHMATHDSDSRFLDCYCCGACGEIDLWLDLAHAVNSQALERYAERRIRGLLIDYKKSGRLRGYEGVYRPRRFPSLFQGASGVGYQAARLLDPALPSLSGHLIGTSATMLQDVLSGLPKHFVDR